jgi:hypothetical protein
MDTQYEILQILQNLMQYYPEYPIARHIALATDEEPLMKYNDKTFLEALQKYEEGLSFSGGLDDNVDWDDVGEY